MKTNNKGFSLVELIVVIAVMAILAAVAIPTFSGFITKAQDASSAQEVADLAYAADLACVEYSVTYVGAVTADKATFTFTGTNANDAATQTAGTFGGDSSRISVSDGVITLTFEKALSASGITKAQDALN